MPYVLEPDVAGGWGDGTVADTSIHPPEVERLEYKFDNWNGDDLLESFPCFIVNHRLAAEIKQSNLTGHEIRSLAVSTSDTFEELQPNRVLPEFKWLHITGVVDKDDFALGSDYKLVVSDKAYRILKKYNLVGCKIEKQH